MKPWFKKEAEIIPFPKKPERQVIKMPSVSEYPDFISGVQDLQARRKQGQIGQDSYNKLYQDLIQRFMKKEDAENPWFIREVYASTNQEYQILNNLLLKNGLKVRPGSKTGKLTKTPDGRNIRANNTPEQIVAALQKLGAKTAIKKIPNVSGKLPVVVAQFPTKIEKEFPILAGKQFNIVSGMKKGSKVAVKGFTPSQLGLAGKEMSRSELYQSLQKIIPAKLGDDPLSQLLVQLAQVAVKKRSAVDPEVLEEFNADDLRQLGIDYGEILAPLMGGEDKITFPSGNAPLADVEINGKLISVKSAGGSGTSMASILPYLNKLKSNKAIKLNKEELQVEKFFRAFTDTKGKNRDKIIAGSQVANTKEHQALEKLIGVKNFTYQDLLSYAGKFKKNEYGKFLKAVYPVSIAGGYRIKDQDRPNGLPRDAAYYMKLTDKKPPEKQAGRPFWLGAGPSVAGANIILYILATSFLKDAKQANKKEKYSNFLSKALQGANAELNWVNVNPDGTLTLNRKAFKDVKVDFQYHAPSHIPANNLPGVSLKL